VRVTNMHSKEVYRVRERVVGNRVTLKMYRLTQDKQQFCTYSKSSGFGHTIYGLECLPAVNLPAACFCLSGSTANPYLPLSDLMDQVAKNGQNLTQTWVSGFKQLNSWQVRRDNLDLKVVFQKQHPVLKTVAQVQESLHRTNGDGERRENNDDDDIADTMELVPVFVQVANNASKPNFFSARDAMCGNVKLQYTILEFLPHSERRRSSEANEDEDQAGIDDFGLSPINNDKLVTSRSDTAAAAVANEEKDWTLPPKGIFCQRPEIFRRKLPEIPDQFSVNIETIDEEEKTVTYSQQHYDVSDKLVSFRFAPRSHSPPAIFFARFILSSTFPNEAFKIVQDFHTQLQYTINERSGNCSVKKIPLTAPDVVGTAGAGVGGTRGGGTPTRSRVADNAHVRVKHAKELLNIEASRFVYAGERSFRGVPADVWVAERPESRRSSSGGGGQYQTTELYFSRTEWKLLVDEVNPLRSLPLGMTTFIANSKNSSGFHTRVTSHYVDFNPTQPDWNFFDISMCVRPTNRMFLKVTLEVSYSQLIQFSLQKAHDSIRKAIASLIKVSPLRISDLHLSSTPGTKQGIDVWFVILGSTNANLVGRLGKNAKLSDRQMTANEAYRNLAKVISQRNVPVKLQISSDRQMVATVRRHSLQLASASTHPNSGGHRFSGSGGGGVAGGLSYGRFLRVTYTAGSMAGLGFSMAILGLGVGIFLGFLLWKRRIGLPYYLAP